MNEFAFVVLNYCAFDVTDRCLNSLFERIDGQYSVIVVDNGSPDGSGKRLEKKYENMEKVKIILNEENLGFSKGMNEGFLFAKRQGYGFIVLLNNDIELLSDGMCKICLEDYKKFGFSILGPYIVEDGLKNCSRNPYHCVEKSGAQMKKEWTRMIKCFPLKVFLARANILSVYSGICKTVTSLYHKILVCYKGKEADDFDLSNKIIMDCGLHGSFLVFSPEYVNRYDGLEPITFACFEEWILYHKCKSEGLLMMYDSRIRIWHDAHTVQKQHSSDKKENFIFRARMELDAANKMLIYLKENNI